MKRILLISLLVLPLAAKADKTDKVCELVGVFAEQSMKMHQLGMPLSKALESADRLDDPDTTIFKEGLFRSITIEAYDSPQYRTAKHQQRAINSHRTKHHAACLKAN